MSQARIHRQGEKIAKLRAEIKDLKNSMKNCKEVENHIQESERIGFKTIVISSYDQQIQIDPKIKIIKCDKVMDLHSYLSNL